MFTQYIAHFFDEKGRYIGKILVPRAKSRKKFDFEEGTYNIDMDHCSETSRIVLPFVLRRREMFYNIAYSNPFNFAQRTKEEVQDILNKSNKNKDTDLILPSISPHNYKTQLDTKILDELNNLSKPKFKINVKLLIIAGILLLLIYLIATKQINLATLFASKKS
jgi:hypothetical protein